MKLLNMQFVSYLLFINILLEATIKLEAISRQSRSYRGRFTQDINNYELLVPHKVNFNGDFKSFSLPHFYHHDYSFHHRKKRDFSSDDAVHYKLHFNDRDHHIELFPNYGFISPAAISEYHHHPDAPINARRMKRLSNSQCHYTGQVRGSDDSSVAFSSCDGLSGYVQMGNNLYLVEPVHDSKPEEDGNHLHIIFTNPNTRRKREKKNYCNTTNWEEGWSSAFNHYFSQPESFRQKKSAGKTSHHYYIEALVVADQKFLNYHKDKDYEAYILTIMNMVTNFYHDATIGRQIDVTVVRIIYLDNKVTSVDVKLSPDGTKTLKAFCEWQTEMNPVSFDHPQHHDVAILLTRHDLCMDDDKVGCSLMGLANVAAVCDPKFACSINEDGGLVLGVVVAHELGHLMGAGHDDGSDKGCEPESTDGTTRVMAPFSKMPTASWSKCSKRAISDLFKNNLGECLTDEPAETIYKGVDMLPGAVYDANHQCKFLFENLTKCDIPALSTCETLYCQESPTRCITNGAPPADGTSCGQKKWCFEKACVDIGKRPNSVAGGWGDWKEWSQCSRTCGGGVKYSERDCTNPTPKHGGLYCLGDYRRFEICNTEACAEDCVPFRAVQCAEFDETETQGKYHKWKPYPKKMASSPCMLYCINELNVYSTLKPRVADGTPCKSGTNYLCIEGECRKVGCDWILDSNSIEDKCGICDGDGSECHRVNGTFDEIGQGYTKVTSLPRGARNIEVSELKPSSNMIAISDENGEEFYLNGDNTLELDGEKEIDGNVALYKHSEKNRDELFISGPITKKLTLHIAFYEDENPGYTYSYYIRNKNSTKHSRDNNATSDGVHCDYHYENTGWSECNRRCDGGEMKALTSCISSCGEGGAVSDDFCEAAEIKKPEVVTQICNKVECKIKWHTANWLPCIPSEDRSDGTKSRRVWCARESSRWEEIDIMIANEECLKHAGEEPVNEQKCNLSKKTLKHRPLRNIYKNYKNMDTYCPDQPSKSFVAHRKELRKFIRNANHKSTTTRAPPKKAPCDTDDDDDAAEDEQTNNKIVSDVIPKEKIRLEEVKIVKSDDSNFNVSDLAYEKLGDKLGGTIDLSHKKIYHGDEAIKKLRKKTKKEKEIDEE